MNVSDENDKPALGRPSIYDPAKVPEVQLMCEAGATDDEVAKFLGIGLRTLYRWRHQHPAFRQALKAGKDAADDRVERALYQRATGYRRKALKVMQHDGVVVTHEFYEDVIPDVGAIKFWLMNRRGVEWREKQQIEHTMSDLYAQVMQLANDKNAAQRG